MLIKEGIPTNTDQAILEVQKELEEATSVHGPMHSAHEGFSILLEEVDELWDEVRMKRQDIEKMHKEAMQVAAMAIRFMIDIAKIN